MLGKLDREAAIGAAMQAGDEPFDDSSGSKLQALQLSQRPRI
jgi:hypothetical protein